MLALEDLLSLNTLFVDSCVLKFRERSTGNSRDFLSCDFLGVATITFNCYIAGYKTKIQSDLDLYLIYQ